LKIKPCKLTVQFSEFKVGSVWFLEIKKMEKKLTCLSDSAQPYFFPFEIASVFKGYPLCPNAQARDMLLSDVIYSVPCRWIFVKPVIFVDPES